MRFHSPDSSIFAYELVFRIVWKSPQSEEWRRNLIEVKRDSNNKCFL